MKKLSIREEKTSKRGGGFWPFAWRYLLFVVVLTGLLLLLLLSVRSCGHNGSDEDNWYEPIDSADWDASQDSADWPVNPYEDVPQLPDPVDNHPQQPDDDNIVEQPEDGRTVVNNRLNLILEKENENTMRDFAVKFKQVYPDPAYQIVFYDDLTYLVQIAIPAGTAVQVMNEMPGKMPEFKFKFFDEEIFQTAFRPTDPDFSDEAKRWYFAPIQAYEAWDVTRGSADVTVAVVDGFFNLAHPEFAGKVVAPFSAVRRSSNVAPPAGPIEQISHGTHVAALATGRAGNGTGVCGIAPECKLMPVSVFYDQLVTDAAGNQFIISSSLAQAEGILYAIYKGADVINVSIGSVVPGANQLSPEQQMEIIRRSVKKKYAQNIWDFIFKIAADRNCVIVWAAGNEHVLAGLDASKRNNTTLRVSAVGRDLKPTDFSNYGYRPDGVKGAKDYSSVSAPGDEIWSASQTGYMMMKGTSMAAPIVTGAVALMKSLDRSLTAEQIIKILQETGREVGEGCGPLIQIRAALNRIRGEFMSYDDVVKRPDAILGLWESTTPLYETATGHPVKIYFQFTSHTSGTLLIHNHRTDEKYSAPLQVSISSSGVTIQQPSDARGNLGGIIQRYLYRCSRGEAGKLKCEARNQVQQGQMFECYLRKVK